MLNPDAQIIPIPESVAEIAQKIDHHPIGCRGCKTRSRISGGVIIMTAPALVSAQTW